MRNKTLQSTLVLALLSLFASCHESDRGECFDESRISVRACTYHLAPVCGCDGKTYDNSCIAERSGVTHWTNGDCK